MPTNNLTATAQTGTADVVSGLVITDILDLDFDIKSQVVRIKTPLRNYEFDLFGIATVTYTIASHSASITLST